MALIECIAGDVFNDNSTGCTRPRPGFAFYNASKAAVSVKSPLSRRICGIT